MTGQTISQYKVLEKLGEGGMGVVYKAHDTKLDRTVALKFLPDRVREHETEKARFLQEARAAAALNHPNICTIFNVEEAAGSLFMVMEYVDGGTLRGKLPFAKPDDALALALQISEALQEAHAKGIVHRDIKADNVMLTSKGQAKVMDFGLAKLKGSLKLTRTSSTVGTLGYMAPEQIQGGEVDHRSDIFSFGVLLFEMLAGRLPFRGEHEAAMVYSIVNEEPLDISPLVPDLSPIVANLIARCLEKDPGSRYQHFDDIAADLRRARAKTSKVMRSSPHQAAILQEAHAAPLVVPHMDPPPAPAHAAQSRSGLIGIVGAVIALASLAAGVFYITQKSARELNPEMTTRVLQIPFTQVSYPGISPDGKWVAFPAADAAGKWDIYYMHADEGEPRRITFDSAAFIQQVADISPDGSRIVYSKPSADGRRYEIHVTSSLGGSTKRLAEGGILARWRPDGRRVGYMKGNDDQYRSESRRYEFWTIAADGSENRLEFVDTLGATRDSRFSFCWAPDGRSVGWLRTGVDLFQSIIIHDLETGEERTLIGGSERMDDLSWTANNEIIYSSNRSGNTNLWTIPADGGTPAQITKGSGPDIGMKVSSDGRSLVYLQQQRIGTIWLGSLADGSARQLTFDDREIASPDFSPDGRKIVFHMTDPDPLKTRSGIYVMDRSGGERRRITPDREFATNPRWSPDGRWIAYQAASDPDTGQGPEIHLIDAANPGTPRSLGLGALWGWLNPRVIISQHTVPVTRIYLTSVADTLKKQLFNDSTAGVPLLGGRYFAHVDFTDTSNVIFSIVQSAGPELEALLRGTSAVIMPSFTKKVIPLPEYALPWGAWNFTNQEADYIGFWKNRTEVWKYGISTGKEERLNLHFPEFRSGMRAATNLAGTEVLYTVQRLSSKLVIVENVFR